MSGGKDKEKDQPSIEENPESDLGLKLFSLSSLQPVKVKSFG